ncbi:MAG: hypothetical protein B7Z73_00555 [Planctomycetia bacterium 21-64-5]|nr:MAG: hypothetical protein B7Z73_00555 [Planctomycetia bacterium 21-64-5]HQU41608.1 hypothetical protein [Pirellulales bacterium]
MATMDFNSFVQQLNWSEQSGAIVVVPQNQARFKVKLNRAVEILQQSHNAAKFAIQFELLLAMLARWIKGRDDLQNAFITIRDGALLFVAVRQECEYDEAFEDELSRLDLEIANDVDLDLIGMDVMALPPVSEDALRPFLNKDFALRLCRPIEQGCVGMLSEAGKKALLRIPQNAANERSFIVDGTVSRRFR